MSICKVDDPTEGHDKAKPAPATAPSRPQRDPRSESPQLPRYPKERADHASGRDGGPRELPPASHFIMGKGNAPKPKYPRAERPQDTEASMAP